MVTSSEKREIPASDLIRQMENQINKLMKFLGDANQTHPKEEQHQKINLYIFINRRNIPRYKMLFARHLPFIMITFSSICSQKKCSFV